MGHQIQGVVERRDARNGAARLAPHIGRAPFGAGQPIQWNNLAIDAARFFRGDLEGEDGAIDLDARGLQRLARLQGHRAGEFFAALGNRGADFLQDVGAAPRGHAPRFLEGGNGRDNALLNFIRPGPMDDGHRRAVIGAADFDDVPRFDRPPLDERPNRPGQGVCVFRLVFFVIGIHSNYFPLRGSRGP